VDVIHCNHERSSVREESHPQDDAGSCREEILLGKSWASSSRKLRLEEAQLTRITTRNSGKLQ